MFRELLKEVKMFGIIVKIELFDLVLIELLEINFEFLGFFILVMS